MQKLSPGNSIDAALRLYREHFLTLFSVAGLLLAPVALLQLSLLFTTIDQSVWHAAVELPPMIGYSFGFFEAFANITSAELLFSLLIIARYFLLIPLAIGVLTYVSVALLADQTYSIADAYRLMIKRAPPLVFASLAPFVCSGISIVLMSAFSLASLSWYNGLGWGYTSGSFLVRQILYWYLPAFLLVMLFIRLSLAPHIAILEKQSPLRCWRRSWWLTKDISGRLLIIWALLGFLVFISSTVFAALIYFLLTFCASAFPGMWELHNVAMITAPVVAQLGIILILPLQVLVSTIVYRAQRSFKEGADLDVRVQAYVQ
ncbi:MAG: hypothetical protein HC828_19705 [Blastochloris sp.]|nr:hypothetical protein [Blastochloris sp.]